MKRKFLLLIGALVSVFTTASAWEKPAAPASQPLATDGVTEQYLYNVGAEGFLLGDNDWMTRASALPTYGYKWKVEVLDETVPYYAFSDIVERDNNGKPCDWGWRRMFCDNASAIYVDNNNGANNGTWTIVPGNGNSFAIGNEAIDGLLGVRAAETKDTRCYFTSAYPDETLSTEWYAVSEEEYNKYVSAVVVYTAAVELKAAIDEAKAQYPTIDLSAQEAVYNNEQSTVEQLNAATEAVKDAARNAAGASATWSSPVDVTSSIDNPSFETGAMGKWTTAGSGGDTGVKPNSNGTYTAEPCDGDYLFNTWGRTPLIVEQVLPTMPKGVYKLTAVYASDGGNVGRLYANADTLDIDASRDGKGVFVEGTLITAVADGNLKIGMTSTQWFKADNFRLMYHGNDAEGSQEYVKAIVPQFDEEDQITESVLADYNAAVEAALEGIANVDDAIAAIPALKEAAAAVEENKAVWAKFIEKQEMAKETLQDESIDQSAQAVADLSDYLMEAEDMVNNKELTTEELEAQLVALDAMINAAMQSLMNGADFTRFLKNPEMNNGQGGWSGSPTINANCGEKYGSGDFDVYQIVEEEVPVGLYEISMQGFYREFRDDDANKTAWYNIFEDTEDARTFKADRNVLSYVYMNSNKTPMNCVYDYAVEGTFDAETNTYTSNLYDSGFSVDPYNKYSYPNTMANAAAAFAQGAYQVSAYGLVAKAGDKLRLGVKGNLGTTGNCWAIFDNFKLTFRAKDEAIINKLLPDAKAALDLEEKKVGKDVKELIDNTIQQAESAATVDDKFDALALCFNLSDVVETSVALFKNLETAIADLETALNNAEAIGVAEKTKTEAGVLMNAAYKGWNDGTYTDAEATEAIKNIEEMIKLLLIPEFIGSDDNPVDFTGFIKDAESINLKVSGSNYGAWTFTKNGGNGPGKSDASEFWNGSAANLEFHVYQEITGLPAGKYGLYVEAANSYNGQQPNGTDGRAYLYAEKAGNSVVPSVAIEPQEDDAMQTKEYQVIFTLGEDENVTVGLKTVGVMDARWFVWKNFRLECYGTNSAKADTPDNIAIALSIEDATLEEVVAVPVAIYNASGVKTSTLQKGLNIIRMSNGKTRKVMVR